MVGVLHYHVSPARNRDSIEEHGLDAGRATYSPWSNCDDWDEGTYLWNDRDVAQQYADELLLDAADVWEVEVSGIPMSPDPSITPDTPEFGSFWQRHAFYTRTPVAPSRLRHVGTDWDTANQDELALA